MADTLLDTTIVVDFLRGRQPALSFVAALSSRPHVSVVTLAEICAGLRSQRGETAARGFFATCRAWPVTAAIAEEAGAQVRHYGRSHGLDLAGAMIAATSLHHGLALATLDIKHFPMFPRLKTAY